MSTDKLRGNFMNAPTQIQSAQIPMRAHEHAVAAPAQVAGMPVELGQWNIAGFLSALRRRWFLTLCLGIPAAGAAAFAGWSLIPAPYTAFAEVRVRSHVAPPPGRTIAGPKHSELKQTQMQLVRDRRVIELALQAKGVGKLALLREAEDPLQWLEENLKVFARGSEFFRVSIVGANPNELAQILNAITNAYFAEIVKKDHMALTERVQLYEKLRLDAQESLLRKRKAMRTIAESAGPNESQLDEKQKSLQEYRLGLLKQKDDIDLRIFKLELLLQHRKKNRGKSVTAPVSDTVVDDHLNADTKFREAKKNVESTQDRFEYNKKTLLPNHEDVEKSRAEMKAAEKKLEDLRHAKKSEFISRLTAGLKEQEQQETAKITEEIEFLKTTKAALEKKIGSAELVDRKIGRETIDLADQKQAIDRQEAFVGSLMAIVTQLKAQIEIAEKERRIELWRAATPPTVPSRKKKYMGTAMAGVGAFGLVFLAIAFFDIRTRRICSIQQVVDRVGIPILGTVPLIPRSASTRKKGRWAGRARYWHSVLTESIDATRTLLLRDALSEMQIFMVASAVSGEGKTTTSCHLATSLARAGNHVLLVDGDLRRPFVHRTFDLASGPGLAEVLRGEAELDSVLQPSGIARMPVLAAGAVDQAALSLLAQGRLADCIEIWREQFDYVVIDSSPILPVTDGLLIARHVDGVLFAVRRDVSRMSKVISACERLSMLGVPILGAVAIGLEHDDYGYHPYYGYNNVEVEN